MFRSSSADPAKLKIWKWTDGDAKSYQCGKSIYGQTILSSELSVSINAQVEAPGHGKWRLDGKTGVAA
jgi:hypothetical protein